jgi:hypothetical protein
VILGVVRRILKEDLSKAGEVPGWLDSLLTPLNQFIETATQALTGRLTFKDNFFCRTFSVKLTHDTDLFVNPQTTARVIGVLPIYAEGQTIDGFKMTRKNDGTIGVRLKYVSGTSTTQATCTFILLLE